MKLYDKLKRSGSKSAFDEAYEFAKDPRPFEVKSAEYESRRENASPAAVQSVNMSEGDCIG